MPSRHTYTVPGGMRLTPRPSEVIGGYLARSAMRDTGPAVRSLDTLWHCGSSLG